MKRKFKQLLKEKKEVFDQLLTLGARMKVLEDEIKKTCEHEELIQGEDYYPATYYDKSENHTWDECVHCHKKFNYKRSVGGFG